MIKYIVASAFVLIAVASAAAPASEPAAAAGGAAAAAAPVSTGPSPVTVLDSKNFDDKVSYYGEDEWLLEFYAPWCTHCQHFAPTYDRIAVALQAIGKKVAKIDCVAAKDICTRFGVSGYPTIKLVRGKFIPPTLPGQPALTGEGRRVYDFSGERTLDGLVAFVTAGGYVSATSEVFPKPGEALEGSGSITKLILAHPYLSGGVLALIVLLLVFFIWVMVDSMREDIEDGKDVAAAKAKKDASTATSPQAGAAASGDVRRRDTPTAASGDEPTPEAAASPKRRTQRAD